ncbi:MAG: TrmH family RNA methyltransferase, partial [Sneathiella sp.]
TRHISWQEFNANRLPNRLILLTTRSRTAYTDFTFSDSDILLLGRESAGVPDSVHNVADHRLCIPMAANMRSINVALSAAMVLGEALRQTGHFSTSHPSVEPTEQP